MSHGFHNLKTSQHLAKLWIKYNGILFDSQWLMAWFVPVQCMLA